MYKPQPFNDLRVQFFRSARLTGILLGALVIGIPFGLDPALVLGMITGGIVSIVNAYFLSRRINNLLDVLTDAKKFSLTIQLSYMMRFGFVMAVCFLALKVSFINVFGVGAGILLMPCMTAIDAAVTLHKHLSARDAVDKI